MVCRKTVFARSMTPDELRAVHFVIDNLQADKLRQEHTLSGTPLKTVYTRDDVDPARDADMPSVYPFTRGLYPDGYALTPWAQQMVFGYGTAEETRERTRLWTNVKTGK